MKDRASRPERFAVLSFALARTTFCGYRAATQSVTVDEATTYLSYVREHWANVWSTYDPNNHILYSILAQLSVRALHISELSLRLPSVLAGFFFVIGLHRVLEATVQSRVIRWTALVAISLAPLLLDFSIAARGYGLGLALLIWAIYFSIRGRDLAAGILAGLSMAATFNLAYSVIGLVAGPLLLGSGGLAKRLHRSLVVAFSAAAIFMAICYPALRQVKVSQLYVGEPTINAALYNLVFLTIRAVPGHPGWFGNGAGAHAIEYFFLPAVLVFVMAVSVREFRQEKHDRRELLPALTLILALAAIAAAHFVAGLNYPVDRLGLHLFILLGPAWAIAVSHVANPRVRIANALLAVLLIGQFLTQFHTRYFALWVFDSSMKEVAQRIRQEVQGKPPGSIAISATWFHTPALEYYRTVYRITALQPVERHEHTQLHGFDYFVLNLKDDDDLKAGAPLPDEPTLFRDDLSGVVLLR